MLDPKPFYGLSGMGDLILTTTGGLSRNKQFGLDLAKGHRPEEIIKSQRSVVEGYRTAKAIDLLSKRYAIHCLLFRLIYKILYEGLSLEKAIKILVDAPPQFETKV